MISKLVKKIGESWNGTTEPNVRFSPMGAKVGDIYGYFDNRKRRTIRFKNSVNPNNSTKNRMIISIKTANHTANPFYYKDCSDGN